MSGEIRFGTTLKKNKMALPKGLASLMYRSPEGHVAEWLRSGLQNRLPRFNSGRGLQGNQGLSFSSSPPAKSTIPFPARLLCDFVAERSVDLVGGLIRKARNEAGTGRQGHADIRVPRSLTRFTCTPS